MGQPQWDSVLTKEAPIVIDVGSKSGHPPFSFFDDRKGQLVTFQSRVNRTVPSLLIWTGSVELRFLPTYSHSIFQLLDSLTLVFDKLFEHCLLETTSSASCIVKPCFRTAFPALLLQDTVSKSFLNTAYSIHQLPALSSLVFEQLFQHCFFKTLGFEKLFSHCSSKINHFLHC